MSTSLTPILDGKELLQLMGILRQARRVVVCGHNGPDGDAIGSAIAWAEYLKHLGKHVTVVMPSPCPDFLFWLPGARQIIFYNQDTSRATDAIAAADLTCCLDFREMSRLQDMAGAISGSKATCLIIDHHLGSTVEGDMLISRPEMSSTCEIVLRLLDAVGGFDDLSRSAAAALYTGMMTDTGAFTYNSNNPEIFILISMLLSKGIDKDKIYRNVYYCYSEYRLRLTGYILNEKLTFYEGHKASIYTLTREEMKRFHFIRGDAEGLVNMPLQVKGMRLSISLREDTEKDIIRVSLRSVDDFPCNKMAAEFFNGGGHLNASGGQLPMPLDTAVKTAEQAIEAYRELL